MGLRYGPLAFVTDHALLPGGRRPNPCPLPAPPAVSATATACPGRGRDGRGPFTSGRQLREAPSLRGDVESTSYAASSTSGSAGAIVYLATISVITRPKVTPFAATMAMSE